MVPSNIQKKSISFSLNEEGGIGSCVAMKRQGNGDGWKQGLCKFFLAGTCKKGSSCQFSHGRAAAKTAASVATGADVSKSSASTPFGIAPRPPGPRALRPQAVASFHQWRQLLARDDLYVTKLSSSKLRDFFRVPIEVARAGDDETTQTVVCQIATDAGLERVKQLTDDIIPAAGSDRLSVWDHLLKPYMQFLTYPSVINSPILENQIGILFNFLVGFNGTRMATVYSFIFGLMCGTADATTPKSEMLALVSLVLLKMVTVNTTTLVNEAFQQTTQELRACIPDAAPSDDYYLNRARSSIRAISLRLGVGECLPVAGRPKPFDVTRATYILHQDLPGKLSSEGARHINDHEEISKISILPPMEEVQALRTEYRPLLDSSQWHISGIGGLLDRHFRLIREDTVGQLRDAVQAEIQVLAGKQGRHSRRDGGVRVYSYPDAAVVGLGFDTRAGFIFDLQCRHPQLPSAFRAAGQRSKWWSQTKRLQQGGLVCLVDPKAIMFCRVHSLPLSQFDTQEHMLITETEALLRVRVQLAEPKVAFLEQEIARLAWRTPPACRSLVEFPGVLLDSFKPILEALQQRSRYLDLPFNDILAPNLDAEASSILQPPLYATRASFTFDLSVICKPGTMLSYSPREAPKVDALCTRTTLDSSQAEALFNCLRRSLALVQGPPGTGKSYMGESIVKVLVANKREAKLGPILCVCYTNHALDQLLEHLWKGGIRKIVRIGSRSKSELLENVNLRKISRRVTKSKNERYLQATSLSALEETKKEVDRLISHLERPEEPAYLLQYLMTAAPQFFEFFSNGTDEEGFKVVSHKTGSVLHSWLDGGDQGASTPRAVELLKNMAPSALTNYERHLIYQHWVREAINAAVAEFATQNSEFEESQSTLDKVRHEIDLRCLRGANIVGVTTTGLAQNIHLLRMLGSKALLCEEAGEVLEGHLLTALLPSIEHAILIGDHRQLRPHIQNYELQSSNPYGEKYSLDMSLFERLVDPPSGIRPDIPYNMLQIQRRMHPSISDLIRKTLYPDLFDAPNVSEYPPVTGMKKRLFWFDHSHPEAGSTSISQIDTSHSNDFEVTMTAALVSHLVRQGVYDQDDIAVLTPYLGQLHKLRRQLSKVFEIVMGERDTEQLHNSGLDEVADGENAPNKKAELGRRLRISTVDNFQGEQAKIIVISLVRSNKEKKCGFLRTTNRINVLLSRAQHGMYIIGDFETYSPVEMWSTVISSLQEAGNFGTEFELECPRHPDKPILVSEPDHFVTLSPEGGCQLACDKRLACGHQCLSKCHSDIIHKAVRCLEPCSRPKKGCDHACPNVCGDPCEDKCSVVMHRQKLRLQCGHEICNPRCWQAQHPDAILCEVRVHRKVPGCQHMVTVPCYTDVADDKYTCKARCIAALDCGHACARQCHKCRRTVENMPLQPPNHRTCISICGRPYSTCRHQCTKPCHSGSDCEPCRQPCEARCSHSKCSLECNEPCAPCAESRCGSSCLHSQCTMPCAAPCDWLPCNRRCPKVLTCGHQCPSICGEACPSAGFCQVCADVEVKETIVDMIEFKKYKEINLDEDPCIFPDCGHVKTLSTLDGVMDMASNYEKGPKGEITSIKAFNKPLLSEKTEAKSCPNCRGSLRNICRYGRIVRRELLLEAHQKFMAWVKSEHDKLSFVLDSWESEDLSGNLPPLPHHLFDQVDKLHLCGKPGIIVKLICRYVGGKRYKVVSSLWSNLEDYLRKTQKEEQPFQRVYDHVQHARRQCKTANTFAFDQSAIQSRGEILALCLLVRCLLAILTDFVSLRGRVKNPGTTITVDFDCVLATCDKLVELAWRKSYPKYQLEAHVWAARLCGLASPIAPHEQNPTGEEPITSAPGEISPPRGEAGGKKQKIISGSQYLEIGRGHIEKAREIASAYGSCQVLVPEIEAAEAPLRRGTFYQPISADEKKAISLAMQNEFRGGGHWYTCANGHPFTIGECGMPMEQARCPECEAPIGGFGHNSVEGVTLDEEMDNLAHRMGPL